MKPEIDRDLLAADCREWLSQMGLTTRSAASTCMGLNPAMVSRACTGQVLSAASLLTLCLAMHRDPNRYLTFATPGQRNQHVTAIAQRETGERP